MTRYMKLPKSRVFMSDILARRYEISPMYMPVLWGVSYKITCVSLLIESIITERSQLYLLSYLSCVHVMTRTYIYIYNIIRAYLFTPVPNLNDFSRFVVVVVQKRERLSFLLLELFCLLVFRYSFRFIILVAFFV